MSGACVAATGACKRMVAPPPAPLSCTIFFTGDTITNVTAASGFTGGAVGTTITGGTGTYVRGDVTVTSNPSGKLSLASVGGSNRIAWSGFTVNEAQYLTVNVEVEDSAGAIASASDSWFIKRVS